MNLALRDIAHAPARFLLTTCSVAFLMLAVIGMLGLYKGVMADALMVLNRVDADLWIVQGGTKGPIAEVSSVPRNVTGRVDAVQGVAWARGFTQFDYQITHKGRQDRATILGLDVPRDDGSWITLAAGRLLTTTRYEAIADKSLHLALGEAVQLGRDSYRIVGVADGMVDTAGDGLVFVGMGDALDILSTRTSEDILLTRAAEPGATGRPAISAVLAGLTPGADPDTVRARIEGWGDVSVLSQEEQRVLTLSYRLGKLRAQLLAFTGLILIVTCIVVSLIMYSMTVEKLHEIATLKLLGARNAVIAGLIGQQALLMGLAGYGVGVAVSLSVLPYFPRRVIVDLPTLAWLSLALLAICLVASWVGIARAMKVDAREVLS
ncbi:ABC transporter permease [Pseudooceanicola sp. HF7]|uniref:ABC transporter permease n=1 Tax=Pseudooceanicola sp. HF7 TaxID=2721560 RepID=UPI0014317257|nr:ABC transporter permease [Pseudooceanicola sp. HF7]NIZ08092.1 ABC transporter permease [Pseudooceanicola sp. HF7]